MPIFLVVTRLLHRAGRYRELALIALAFVIVLIGAALFSLTEHIGFGTAVYWAVTTATTVGYGDVTPHNTAGRVIAAGVMLTTIPIVGAVFALFAGASAVSRIRRLLGMEARLPQQPYTLVYGSHPMLRPVLPELRRSGDPIVLVAPHMPPGAPSDIELIAGDPTDDAVIQKSQPARANRALIACPQDSDTLIIAVALHGLAPDLEVYAITHSDRVARALRDLGVTHALAADELIGHTLAKSLETPRAGDLLLTIVESPDYELSERPVDAALLSRRLSDARAQPGALVLGIARGDRVDLGLADDPVLSADDRLIVLSPVT
jgi:voltage-gated potassium channel